ncbi:DUF2203 family protein [bacterium]|nr:DUF2203 family protein [bacterium]
MEVPRRHFTVAEGEALIPDLTRWLDEIREQKTELDKVGFDVFLGAFQEGRSPNGTGSFPPAYTAFVAVARRFVEAGVHLKSIEEGIVDIYALRPDGESVCLCWQYGDTAIHWWHPEETGYAGRLPIEEF